MYKLLDSGIGKKWCGDEVIILEETLSQNKLKKLYNRNCEFVVYEQETTSEETETSSSTAKEDKSVSTGGRKAKRGKATRKPKAN